MTSGAISAGLPPGILPAARYAAGKTVAAVGQGLLMQVYEKLFAEYGQVVAQVLLTREDLRSRNVILIPAIPY